MLTWGVFFFQQLSNCLVYLTIQAKYFGTQGQVIQLCSFGNVAAGEVHPQPR